MTFCATGEGALGRIRVVEATGFGVTLFKPGDEVSGMLPYPYGVGSHAEYVVGPTRAFVLKPGAFLPSARDRHHRRRRLLGHVVGAEPHGLALAADGTPWVALKAGFLAHLVP